MDGLGVRPVLPESRDEFDHSVDVYAPPPGDAATPVPPSPGVINVEPLPKATIAVAAVVEVAASFGRRGG